VAAAFELYSWRISYRELLLSKDSDETIWQEIIGSKDPTIFTIFLEDSAGLIGAVLAFLGIFLGQIFHSRYFDPAASIFIGLLLAAVSLLLGRESGALLVGERTNRARIRRVKKILEEDPAVEAVGDILTMQMGPDQVLLTVEIRFRRGLDVQQVESAIDRSRIRQQEPTIRKIFIEPDSLKTPARKSSKAA
jgi:divalent metal cation (Fe/Co/Zn/Cd) transporter